MYTLSGQNFIQKFAQTFKVTFLPKCDVHILELSLNTKASEGQRQIWTWQVSKGMTVISEPYSQSLLIQKVLNVFLLMTNICIKLDPNNDKRPYANVINVRKTIFRRKLSRFIRKLSFFIILNVMAFYKNEVYKC